MPDEKIELSAAHQPEQIAEHVAGAHTLLQTLQARIGEHPELAEAILELQTALNTLTVKTGAML